MAICTLIVNGEWDSMAKPKQGAVHVIWGQTESGPIKTGQNRMTSGLSAEREFKKR